ncbi:hypothetical protein GK047_25045 [Paenibacillus sp. SYP-B3998]|uniref:GyrI-like small molecule binding domain-containing protein n=1 Tax=Paenibacillus sp. SYP-B3998 TaxID=2678564 RepID=A0A6G4A5Z2_9BACL|nr:GyrI-like domain-containing protein [Paenibacillus sp. SYP-B3998]NEW09241.1 hypothetical protein [Paenibacillus sp. SYP-B3998]
MDKLDLAKINKSYYTAPTYPQLVAFELISYVTIARQGDPNGTVFAHATEALYTLAYSVKGICKKEGRDFTVAKLEGLWWVDGERTAMEVPSCEWNWKLMIRVPDYVTMEMVESARQIASLNKKEMVTLSQVHYETLHEGKCVQMLHVGPYSTEQETVKCIEIFMHENRLKPYGRHHEIYLSDPRKVEPLKMKTILRHPVQTV